MYLVFQPSTVIGQRGLRGHRVVLIAVIIELELVRLRVLQTGDDTVLAEIRCPVIVREDLVSVSYILLNVILSNVLHIYMFQ